MNTLQRIQSCIEKAQRNGCSYYNHNDSGFSIRSKALGERKQLICTVINNKRGGLVAVWDTETGDKNVRHVVGLFDPAWKAPKLLWTIGYGEISPANETFRNLYYQTIA